MDVLILARGGSKGVPNKNIKLLNGIPLIHYIIDAAKKCKLVEQIYISTDSDLIAEIVSEKSVNIVKRPKELSTDLSLDVDSFRHFCSLTNYSKPLVHLRATTPLIEKNIVDTAIETFDFKRYTSLRSAHETPESGFKLLRKKLNLWTPILEGIDPNSPRQTYEKTFTPNGHVDIVNPEVFMNQETFYGDKIYAFETKFTPEIDTIEDFEYIEYILSKKLNV
jgi:CMP-N,N'-diacetyllegionaminic acid synthase